jgi:hypothetical protein
LLAIQPRRFVVTTNSKHKCEVHLNLASRMTLTGINQLWVADLTYVRLKGEFVYLAVILDGFSRKVVGWAVDRTLMSSHLTVAALERAVADRRPQAGLVHHSDRGLQYASPEYVAALDRHSMVASISRPANPYDNASCESFMKTLKREEIYANRYDDLDHLRVNVEEFIEQYSRTLADFEINDIAPSHHCSVITPIHVSLYGPVPRNTGSPLARASESLTRESGATSTTRRTEASASAAKIRPAGQTLLGRRSSILVRMATIPHCGHAGNRGALAQGRIPFVLEADLQGQEDRRETTDVEGGSGIDLPDGR